MAPESIEYSTITARQLLLRVTSNSVQVGNRLHIIKAHEGREKFLEVLALLGITEIHAAHNMKLAKSYKTKIQSGASHDQVINELFENNSDAIIGHQCLSMS